MLFAIVAALAASPSLSATTEELHILHTAVLAIDAPGTRHRLPLHLYAFSGSRWERDTIVAAVASASALLAQCDIAIAPAHLTELDAPRRYLAYATPRARQLLRLFPAARPAVFFVDETLNRPAYDAETIGLANARTRPELAHTVWVAHGARDLPLALAHELVHLLSNTGEHSAAPLNLMRADTALDNTRLTSEQCAKARASGLEQGLLVPRR